MRRQVFIARQSELRYFSPQRENSVYDDGGRQRADDGHAKRRARRPHRDGDRRTDTASGARQAGPAHRRATHRDLLGHRWLAAHSPRWKPRWWVFPAGGFKLRPLAKRFPAASLWLCRGSGCERNPCAHRMILARYPLAVANPGAGCVSSIMQMMGEAR